MTLCGVAIVGLSLASADASMYASAPAKSYAPAPAMKYEEKKSEATPAPAKYAPSPAKYEAPAPAMKYEEKKEAYAAPAPAMYEATTPTPAKYEEKTEGYATTTPQMNPEYKKAYGAKKSYKRAVDDSKKEGAKKDVTDDPVELRMEIKHLQKALRTAIQADPSYYSRGYGYGYGMGMGYGYPYYKRRGYYYDEDDVSADEERAKPMSDDDVTDQHAKHSHGDSDAIEDDTMMITADELREMMDALVINRPPMRPCPRCRCPPRRRLCRPGVYCKIPNRQPVALRRR